MSIKTSLDKFNKNEFLVFVLTLWKIWDIVKSLKNGNNMTLLEFIKITDWSDVIFSLTILLLLFIALRNIRLLKTQLLEADKRFENYKVSKGQIDQMLMKSNVTNLRAFVAYVNSQEDVNQIALTLLNAGLAIPDCEEIGISVGIIATMKKELYAVKHDQQNEILNKLYPDNKEKADGNDKKE